MMCTVCPKASICMSKLPLCNSDLFRNQKDIFAWPMEYSPTSKHYQLLSQWCITDHSNALQQQNIPVTILITSQIIRRVPLITWQECRYCKTLKYLFLLFTL